MLACGGAVVWEQRDEQTSRDPQNPKPYVRACVPEVPPPKHWGVVVEEKLAKMLRVLEYSVSGLILSF